MQHIEDMQNAPDLFKCYRQVCEHPEMERVSGGWMYQGGYYPDYLTVGGACHCIFSVAQRFCSGKGIDIGAGYWPFPRSTPVDLWRGPGLGNRISDYEEGSLDYVFSSHCLEHIENWQETLVEVISKLRVDGVIFLYLPHPECAIWHPGSPFVGDSHIWMPNPNIIKQELKKLGCDTISSDDGPDAMQSFYVCACKRNGKSLQGMK